MIGHIRGEVVFNDTKSIIISTMSGLGYQVTMSTPELVGSSIELFTAHIKKDDRDYLYGFKDPSEKKVFEKLLSVNGVGPKSAYSLVATLGLDGIVQAIKFEEVNTIKSAPGIGAKAAAKIILELKDKLDDFSSLPLASSADTNESKNNSTIVSEALMACRELGYKDKDVLAIIRRQPDLANQTTQEIIKLVLKEISLV